MSTETSQKGFPGSGIGDSEQTWHKLVEAHMGCRGSSILSSHEGRLLGTGGITQQGSQSGCPRSMCVVVGMFLQTQQ